MKIRFALIASLLAVLNLTSCTTPDYDPNLSPARPYIPRVTMPSQLDRDEQNLIGDVENVLEQNNLRPTDRTGAEYQLAFNVEHGPVNADVTLDLYQGRDRIAHAFARVGGPRILFKRQQVIREAFDKAIRQFEAQLPRTGGGGGGGYRPHTGSQTAPDRGYYGEPQGSNYGQPNPYTQPQPDYSY